MKLDDYLEAGAISQREFDVLRLRESLSQWSAALVLGLSRSTVRGIEARALQKINLHNKEAA